MFLGEYIHAVDPKGRIAIPAKFREKLARGAIITKGVERCLFVFSAEEWQKFAEEKFFPLPFGSASARAFVRHMTSGAADVEFDAQGRVLVPSSLREYANLSKNAAVIGVGARLEIWDAGAWKSYQKKTDGAAEEIAEKLSELGI